MGTIVTIFWLELTRGELRILHRTADRCGARVEAVTADRLAPRMLAALRLGGVIVVVADDAEASHAFKLGASAVLRAGEIDPVSVRRAVHDAHARSLGVQLPRTYGSEAWQGSQLMLDAICDEVSARLTRASTNCEILFGGLPTVLAAGDRALELAGGAAGAGEDAERLRALRLTQPTSEELAGCVQDTRAMLQEATAVMHAAYRLRLDNSESVVQVAPVLYDLERVLTLHRKSGVRLRVNVTGSDRSLDDGQAPSLLVGVAHTPFVKMMLTLLSAAFESAAASDAPDPEVCLSANSAEGYVLFEIHHPGALGAWIEQSDESGSQESELSSVRRLAQDFDGELLMDTDPMETTMRLILPSEQRQDVMVEPRGRRAPRLRAVKSADPEISS